MFMELFPKVLKWALSAFFLIMGLSFLISVQQTGHPGPIILAIFSFGIVFWLYRSASEVPWQVAIASLLIFAAAAGAALYIPVYSFPFNINFFLAWAAWSLIIGIPAIALAYRKYG